MTGPLLGFSPMTDTTDMGYLWREFLPAPDELTGPQPQPVPQRLPKRLRRRVKAHLAEAWVDAVLTRGTLVFSAAAATGSLLAAASI